jgi:hypothetical protein
VWLSFWLATLDVAADRARFQQICQDCACCCLVCFVVASCWWSSVGLLCIFLSLSVFRRGRRAMTTSPSGCSRCGANKRPCGPRSEPGPLLGPRSVFSVALLLLPIECLELRWTLISCLYSGVFPFSCSVSQGRQAPLLGSLVHWSSQLHLNLVVFPSHLSLNNRQ